jgi:uncharacterized paraquat-inducible protein A
MKFSWVLAVLGALIGGCVFAYTLLFADSAPKQAAGAAIAMAWVVLPYCFARALAAIESKSVVGNRLCPECKSRINERARRCPACCYEIEEPPEWTCTKCGEKLNAGQTPCPHCRTAFEWKDPAHQNPA